MKTAKFTVMFLACAAAIPAFAQSTTDSGCGMTNFDRNGNMFTVVNPASGAANQQCFITVVSKQEWTGGAPNLAGSQFVEGNYEVALAGGGGAGGGAARNARGHDGSDSIPARHTRYLAPGVYRLTIGSGGQGGEACITEEQGGRGGDGAPTSLSEAYGGKTIAGYPGAESWNGGYSHNMTASARSGEFGGGVHGAGGNPACGVGASGGNGFIKLAFKDPVPQPARVQSAPPMSSQSQSVTTPPPADIRPARRDRN